jgi:hypothetical protein
VSAKTGAHTIGTQLWRELRALGCPKPAFLVLDYFADVIVNAERPLPILEGRGGVKGPLPERKRRLASRGIHNGGMRPFAVKARSYCGRSARRSPRRSNSLGR